MCPSSRERAQAALGVLAASARARLGALRGEWKGWRSSAGAQHCGNHAARFTLSKNLPFSHVCGSKPLPNSCSNSSLLNPKQKGALPAGLSSLSQRVKFQLNSPFLHATGTSQEHVIGPSHQSHFAAIGRKPQTDGWVF